jgi:hypothetical protein
MQQQVSNITFSSPETKPPFGAGHIPLRTISTILTKRYFFLLLGKALIKLLTQEMKPLANADPLLQNVALSSDNTKVAFVKVLFFFRCFLFDSLITR